MNITRLIATTSIISSLILINTMWNSDPARSQACVVTDSGETVCGKPSKSLPNPKANRTTEIRETINNFLIVFKGCRRSGTTVECTYTIRNKGGGDSSLSMNPTGGKLVESSGKPTNSYTLDLAGSNSGMFRTIVIEQGLDYTATVGFYNISEDVNTIVKLYLPFGLRTNLYYQNIPISN